MPYQDNVSILIPTSPFPALPDTSVIEETIKSVRFHFPTSEIVLMIDGIREQHEDRRGVYQEYIQRILWLANTTWKNTHPLMFDEHTHQAGMTRKALESVRTPLILFAEHDCPLVMDEPIDWELLIWDILSGKANVIRFHFESHILKEHEHLAFRDTELQDLTKTIQWSQRPHLASTAFYRHLMEAYFTKDSKTMIEDTLHGKVMDDFIRDGMMGWNLWKLYIYTPEGNIKRSLHLDARGSDSKYEDKFIF